MSRQRGETGFSDAYGRLSRIRDLRPCPLKTEAGIKARMPPVIAVRQSLHQTRFIVSEPDDIAFHPVETSRLLSGLRAFQARAAHWLGEEEAYGARFLFLPVCAGAGAIAYFSAEAEPSWDCLWLLAALMASLAYLFRHIRLLSLLSGFLLVGAAGALCAKGESARVATVMLDHEVTTFVTGRIVALDAVEGGGRLVLEIMATQSLVLPVAPARVRLSARRLPPGAAVGDGLKGIVRMRPPSDPVRRGSYDFGFHLYYRGIGAQGFFMGLPERMEVPPPDSFFARLQIRIANLRALMTQSIRAAVGGEAGAISAALITGQRRGISQSANEALRLSGLAHILSISGLHMAMVTGMVLVAVRVVLGLFPVFSSCFPPRKIAAAAALSVSGFYLLLSGGDIAAQRGFVMVAVMLAAVLFDRTAITMRNLAIAALVIIILAPHELTGPGFQMSFAATAALVAVFGWWSARARRTQHKDAKAGRRHTLLFAFVIVPLVSTAVSSLVAGAASGIYAAFHFNNTAPLGILSNALAFPVISVSVMPFALLGAVFMLFHLEWLPLQVMGAGVALVQKIAFAVSAISPPANPGAVTSECLAVLTVGLVLLLFLRSALKYLSFAAFGYGLLLYLTTPLPLALIAENGRLAAIISHDRKLALATSNPPAFLVRNWKVAFNIKEVVGPQDGKMPVPGSIFHCEASYYRARLANGKFFTIAFLLESRKQACDNGDIVFLNFSGQVFPCPGKITVTPVQLALYGTAEIHGCANGAELVWAAGAPARPWNRHRRFSKTARGMP